MSWGSGITALGKVALKETDVTFGIKDRDRAEHVAVVGKSEESRIALLTRMCLQDIERGIGTVIMDADGNLIKLVLERLKVPQHDRLVFLDPSDGEYPFSWNPLDEFRVLPDAERRGALSRALASMYRIPLSPLSDMLASRLLENAGASFVTVYELATDAKFRAREFEKAAAEQKRFEELLQEYAADVEIISEHGRYVAKDTLVRNLLGQVGSKFSLEAFTAGAIVAMDLSRIKMFPTRVAPLSRMLVHAALARAHASRISISLYLHNCLRYLSEDDVESLFSDRFLAITVSDTAVSEEDRPLREKALARSLSIIALSPSGADLAFTEKFLYPYVGNEELSKLEENEFAIALAIDGVRSRPFFARGLPLPERAGGSYQDLIAVSRERYTTPRIKVDQLFKKKNVNTDGDESKQKGKGNAGSFSDAFRSILEKRATSGAPPASLETSVAKPKEDAAPKAPPGEIPKDELEQMLYVVPISA